MISHAREIAQQTKVLKYLLILFLFLYSILKMICRSKREWWCREPVGVGWDGDSRDIIDRGKIINIDEVASSHFR